MLGRLENKRVIVTGASRGIGAAIARACASEGAEVFAHASRPSIELAQLSEAFPAGRVAHLIEDLRAAGAGARLFDAALGKAGRIDAVINNAGVYLPSPIASETELWDAGWNDTLAINLRAPADICRAAIAHFRSVGGGRVVNIASRAGHRGDGLDYAAYAASKGALLALTKTYARALAGEKIYFYAISPGWVETRMAPEDIAARARAVAEIPLGRVAAPEEVGRLAAFVASEDCPASSTGATFDINGASYVR